MSKIVLFLVSMLTISCDSGASIGYPAPMAAASVVNNPPFVKAIEEGSLVEVEQMMPNILDVNAHFYVERAKANFTPLQLAAAYGHRLLVILFLNSGAAQAIDKKTEGSGRTALHLAVGQNHSQTVEVLLKRGADVNAQIEQGVDAGKTPLHLAVENTRPYMVQLLVANKADANIKTSVGKTPLHVAVEKNHAEIAKILVAHGADVDAETMEGKTSLHIALDSNCSEVAKVLVEGENIDVNAKTRAGKTPLHIAAAENLVEIARILVDRGADVHAKTRANKTPLDLARSANHEEIVKILRPFEEKSCRRSCIDWAEDCDRDHCPNGPAISIFGFKLDCSCFKKPCGFAFKTLCCIWCYPLKEGAVHPASSSNSSTAPNPMGQPLLGGTMQR